ncbi:MAG: hypothetical protein Tsb0010_18150 [Parvularculaceae bacterium]
MPVVQSFDGLAGIIELAPGVSDLTAAEIYSEWKSWTHSGAGAPFREAFRVVGGDPIDAATNVGAYFFLQNDAWRIRPAAEDASLTIRGNLYGDDLLSPLFAQTAGDFTVIIQVERSPLSQLVESGVSGLTAQEAADLAAIRTALKILRNRSETDPATGELRIYDDDNLTVLLRGNVYADVAGQFPYDGAGGINRRDRLE